MDRKNKKIFGILLSFSIIILVSASIFVMNDNDKLTLRDILEESGGYGDTWSRDMAGCILKNLGRAQTKESLTLLRAACRRLTD